MIKPVGLLRRLTKIVPLLKEEAVRLGVMTEEEFDRLVQAKGYDR